MKASSRSEHAEVHIYDPGEVGYHWAVDDMLNGEILNEFADRGEDGDSLFSFGIHF